MKVSHQTWNWHRDTWYSQWAVEFPVVDAGGVESCWAVYVKASAKDDAETIRQYVVSFAGSEINRLQRSGWNIPGYTTEGVFFYRSVASDGIRDATTEEVSGLKFSHIVGTSSYEISEPVRIR